MPEPVPGDASAPTSTGTAQVLDEILGSLLERAPSDATSVGEHRHDHLLEDFSTGGLEAERAALAREEATLRSLEGAGLAPEDEVDRQTLLVALRSRAFAIDELAPQVHDPLAANPGGAVYSLLARDFAPLEDRLVSLAGRLGLVPGHLAQSRASLRDVPRVHLETAVGQFLGTRALVDREVAAALGQAPALSGLLDAPRARALEAIDEHVGWLRTRLEVQDGSSDADPRLGPERFARRLSATLDLEADTTPDEVLGWAERHLVEVEAELREVAGGLGVPPQDVRLLLDRVSASGHVDDSTVVSGCVDALGTTARFVRETGLVTVFDDPVEVIVMPEIHRGVAVAYCDAPGALDAGGLPTYFAVAPTPADWPDERVGSFYREYNAHMLHNLTAHEAYPGHVLQLAHSRRFRGSSAVRTVLWNGAFVEGWAVYAEELLVRAGYPGVGGRDGATALRLQQLKMQLRMTVNAILDVRVHTRGMTEDEAMSLMVDRAHQEPGEAHGKWRRALLTSAQLATYFVGYRAVSSLARDLRSVHPDWSELRLHDALLAHGSPAPRHLRTLLLG